MVSVSGEDHGVRSVSRLARAGAGQGEAATMVTGTQFLTAATSRYRHSSSTCDVYSRAVIGMVRGFKGWQNHRLRQRLRLEMGTGTVVVMIFVKKRPISHLHLYLTGLKGSNRFDDIITGVTVPGCGCWRTT